MRYHYCVNAKFSEIDNYTVLITSLLSLRIEAFRGKKNNSPTYFQMVQENVQM